MPPGDVFSALANPVRRRLMEALQDGPCAAGELAGQFALGRVSSRDQSAGSALAAGSGPVDLLT
ncbi:helix-turn-helix domain-containing protein [Streptomyces sp. AK02-04a]|nr:helix-turn-helix domain-containing protein [Streptomyces sp. AK02-04a]MDX3763242.1 helix-turn-helix domain-containing protein [Streptomyces sp. AK02-04a]